MGDEWIKTDNGNWVLPGDDGVEATVYRQDRNGEPFGTEHRTVRRDA
jgi:hypothetical protein